jgi:hypothetical protein
MAPLSNRMTALHQLVDHGRVPVVRRALEELRTIGTPWRHAEAAIGEADAVSPEMGLDSRARVRCDCVVLGVECEPSCYLAVGVSPTVTPSNCSTGTPESADVSNQGESDASSRVLLR